MPQGGGGGASSENPAKTFHTFSAGPTTFLAASPRIGAFPESSRGRTLSYDDLSRCFHLPINAAAKELGVCVTALKKQCRKHGVPRWPHRKLKSLDKLKEKLEREEATAADKEYYKHEIYSIDQKKDYIFRSSAAASASLDRNSPDANMPPHVSGSSPVSLAPGVHPTQQVLRRSYNPVHQSSAVYKAMKLSMPSHYVAQGKQHPTVVPAIPVGADPDHHRMLHTSLVLPVSHISASPSTFAGSNGAVLQHVSAQQLPMCGFCGCDCYANNGVSSHMFHPPLQPNRMTSGIAQTAGPPGPSGRLGNGSVNTQIPSQPGGVGAANMHFYNTTPSFAYGPTLQHVPPSRNMVQVNLMEQPSAFEQVAANSQQPRVPNLNGNMVSSSSAPGVQLMSASVPSATLPSTPTPEQSFDLYSNTQHAVAAPGAIMYNHSQASGVSCDRVRTHRAGTMPIPGYSSDASHHPNPSNLVTLYNRTTLHHYHHKNGGTATGSHFKNHENFEKQDISDASSSGTGNRPRLSRLRQHCPEEEQAQSTYQSSGQRTEANGQLWGNLNNGEKNTTSEEVGLHDKPAPRALQLHVDAAGSKRRMARCRVTMNSEKHDRICREDKLAGNNREVTVLREPFSDEKGLAGSRKSAEAARTDVAVHTMAKPACLSKHPGTQVVIKNSSQESSEEREGQWTSTAHDSRKEIEMVPTGKEKSSIFRDFGPLPSPVDAPSSAREVTPEDQDNGTGSVNDSVDTEDLNIDEADDDCPSAKTGMMGVKYPDDDLRKDVTSFPSRRASSHGFRRDTSSRDGAGTRASSNREYLTHSPLGNTSHSENASANMHALRYDHMVHQCSELQVAQWRTDLNFRVTLIFGPKVLLGLAGVPSLGKSVLDSTETALVSKSTAKTKYSLSRKGERLEWIASSGYNQYLIVMNPFRGRNTSEIRGVSGLMIELKIIQALAN